MTGQLTHQLGKDVGLTLHRQVCGQESLSAKSRKKLRVARAHGHVYVGSQRPPKELLEARAPLSELCVPHMGPQGPPEGAKGGRARSGGEGTPTAIYALCVFINYLH